MKSDKGHQFSRHFLCNPFGIPPNKRNQAITLSASYTCGTAGLEQNQADNARIAEFTNAAERYRAQMLRLAVRIVGLGEEAP